MKFNIEDFKEQFEPSIVEAMTNNNLPGMAIAIVHEDRIIYSRGFGARNLKNYLPYTPDTLNGFGSCTKSLTSLAILHLASQGKLDVHDAVSKYLPFKLGLEGQPITIHHLMSHTSGIPNLGVAELTFSQSLPFDIGVPPIPFMNWDDFYTHINAAQSEIRYKPSEHFFYFNSGYTLLGQLIEKISGLSYEDYIQKHILNPLNMKRSSFLKPVIAKDSNVSVPYVMLPEKEGKPRPTPADFPFNPFIYAAGGLVSSVNEMAQYIIMMMNAGQYEGHQIIAPEYIHELTQIHYAGRFHPLLSDMEGSHGYGYGWGVSQGFLGDTFVQHGGGITGGLSLIGYLKEMKLGFAVIGNCDGLPFFESYASLALLLGKDIKQVFPYFRRQAHYKQLCGEYISYKGINKLQIFYKDGLLYLKSNFPPTSLPLIPKSDILGKLNYSLMTPFGTAMPVEFVIDDQNNVSFIVERNLYHKV